MNDETNTEPVTEMKTIRVQLFGSLREFGDDKNTELHLPSGLSVNLLREELARHFIAKHGQSKGATATEILRVSAFADEQSILSPESSLEGRSWIAVLPPVCGG